MSDDWRAKARKLPKGNLFEDFHVGRVFEHHWGRTLNDGDNTLFSTLTLSYNPLYFNAPYARAHGHRQIVVNPMLVEGQASRSRISAKRAGSSSASMI